MVVLFPSLTVNLTRGCGGLVIFVDCRFFAKRSWASIALNIKTCGLNTSKRFMVSVRFPILNRVICILMLSLPAFQRKHFHEIGWKAIWEAFQSKRWPGSHDLAFEGIVSETNKTRRWSHTCKTCQHSILRINCPASVCRSSGVEGSVPKLSERRRIWSECCKEVERLTTWNHYNAFHHLRFHFPMGHRSDHRRPEASIGDHRRA